MTNDRDALAPQLAQLLADWRYLRRDQIAWLLPDEALPLDPLLADLVRGEVLRLELGPQDPGGQAV